MIHKKARFKIATINGDASVNGFIVGNLGIHERFKNIWTVTHLPTGRRLTDASGSLSEILDRIESIQNKFKIQWNDSNLASVLDIETQKKIMEKLGGKP